MTKREEFIKFVDYLIANCKEQVVIPEDVASYLAAIKDSKDSGEKKEFTENGKAILQYLQNTPAGMYKARDIAEGMFITSKTVSGAMRKLVIDGYVEKVGKDPVVYMISEKGKMYNFNDNENSNEGEN